MFVFISDHIILLDFRKHFVLLLADQIDIDIDHLVVLAVDVDSVQSRMVIMINQ